MTARPWRARALNVLSLSLCATPAGAVMASDFAVTPVRLEIPAGQKSGMLSLENRARAPVRMQLRAFAWTQSPSGAMRLEPAPELVVYPTLVSLRPAERRPIRIGLRAASQTGVERTYRVLVDELPEASSGTGAALRMATRMSIPVFFEPSAPRGIPALGAVGITAGAMTVELGNRGNAHYMATKVGLTARDQQGQAIFEARLPGWYVLAGQPRAYELTVPPDVCSRASTISLDVLADHHTTQLTSPVRCATP